MAKNNVVKYDLEYLGVKCAGVVWDCKVGNVFYFIKNGKHYKFLQVNDISCSADTDHIRCVIEEQFLPWWKDKRIKELELENTKLKKANKLPCNVGDVLYCVSFCLSDVYNDIKNRTGDIGFRITTNTVTETNLFKFCDLVKKGVAYKDKKQAEKELESQLIKLRRER